MNEKQKASERHSLYIASATAKRFSSTFYLLRQFGVKRDLNEQIIIAISVFIAAVLIVPLAEFIYNFIKGPIRIAEDKITSLKEQLKATQAELQQIKESRKAPELVFEPKITEDVLITPHGRTAGMALIAELRISNNSPFESRIIAEIVYRDNFTNNAYSVIGRWIDGPFLNHKNEAVMPIGLAPGQSRRLGIAVKLQIGDMWYALDNKSPFDGYCIENYEFIGPVSITVQLKGDKETVMRNFQLKEENGIPKFDAIP